MLCTGTWARGCVYHVPTDRPTTPGRPSGAVCCTTVATTSVLAADNSLNCDQLVRVRTQMNNCKETYSNLSTHTHTPDAVQNVRGFTSL